MQGRRNKAEYPVCAMPLRGSPSNLDTGLPVDLNALFSSSAILYDGLFVLNNIDDTAGDANEAVVYGLQADKPLVTVVFPQHLLCSVCITHTVLLCLN